MGAAFMAVQQHWRGGALSPSESGAIPSRAIMPACFPKKSMTLCSTRAHCGKRRSACALILRSVLLTSPPLIVASCRMNPVVVAACCPSSVEVLPRLCWPHAVSEIVKCTPETMLGLPAQRVSGSGIGGRKLQVVPPAARRTWNAGRIRNQEAGVSGPRAAGGAQDNFLAEAFKIRNLVSEFEPAQQQTAALATPPPSRWGWFQRAPPPAAPINGHNSGDVRHSLIDDEISGDHAGVLVRPTPLRPGSARRPLWWRPPAPPPPASAHCETVRIPRSP